MSIIHANSAVAYADKALKEASARQQAIDLGPMTGNHSCRQLMQMASFRGPSENSPEANAKSIKPMQIEC